MVISFGKESGNKLLSVATAFISFSIINISFGDLTCFNESKITLREKFSGKMINKSLAIIRFRRLRGRETARGWSRRGSWTEWRELSRRSRRTPRNRSLIFRSEKSSHFHTLRFELRHNLCKSSESVFFGHFGHFWSILKLTLLLLKM